MNIRSLKVLEFNKIKDILKNYVITSAAKDIIENLSPYSNVYDVNIHLKETEEATKLLFKKGSPPFEGLYDIRETLIRAQKEIVLKEEELVKVSALLSSARRFNEYISHKDGEEAFEVLEDLCVGIVPIKKLEDEINNAIEDDVVVDRASTALYSIRRELKSKSLSLKDRVTSLVRVYSKYLQEELYTMRGDRYVLPVKVEYKNSVPGIVHDQSSSGATLFIEPMNLVELNNEIRELMLKERDEVERILKSLSKRVCDNITVILNNSNIIWELDFIFGKAKYANEHNSICPKVNANGKVDIIEGRHPLISKDIVVPTTVNLGDEFTSLVITGPNTGGKTVTLKTIGLLHIMALSGLLIPCMEGSEVSFFEEIYADIGDEQSIEQSLSTFSSHMKNIVNIMEKANEKCLVLFDELGAGTDPTEGAALAISILETLRERNTKIVGTTHYSELKGYALRTEGVENASVEFDVETLRPTYRLLIGIPGKSNAFEISKRLGLSNDVIDRARENISEDSLRFEELIRDLQEKSIKAQNDAREALALKMQMKNEKEKYEKKLESLNKSRDKLLEDATLNAKSILSEAKEEADEILKNIRKMEMQGYTSATRQEMEEQRLKLKKKIESQKVKDKEDDGESPKHLKLGEEYKLTSINQKVILLSMPDNKNEVQVQAGIMKINVKVSLLREIQGQSKQEKKNIKRREVSLNLKNVSSSCDLRGMDGEEATYTADKYLDDAYMAGLSEVTLVHGKGTGVLRKVINDMLKRHPHVKSYRLGEYGEGGTGATVVILK